MDCLVVEESDKKDYLAVEKRDKMDSLAVENSDKNLEDTWLWKGKPDGE